MGSEDLRQHGATQKLSMEQYDSNNINLDQRQRIFEDIIIQRVKIIQNYVKKSIQKLKDSNGGNSTVVQNAAPVILNSIHNDGMSLDLKIKEALKWKLEEFTQKVKAKDDKVMHLEVNRTARKNNSKTQ